MLIALVAGEASGDQLGSGLIRQLKAYYPDARFYGIGGALMREQGLQSLFEMDEISMIGLEGVFTKLPRIVQIRQQLIERFKRDRPDVFIGIDVPDFNLGLEKKLTQHSLTCIHYVSPTIWAWRAYRIKTIKKAVAHMLVLFPFESRLYQDQGIPVTFVGHPIADEVDCVPDQATCRAGLKLKPGSNVIALLPGSRSSEIQRHAELFIQTASHLNKSRPQTEYIISAVNSEAEAFINELIGRNDNVAAIRVITRNVRQVISASDVVLAASGTVTLETALLGKPMVVAYKVSLISEWMVRLFSNVSYYAMPNFLLDKPMVPEFVQREATVENLSKALDNLLDNDQLRENISIKFNEIKEKLKVDSNKISAQVVRSYLRSEQ